MIKGTSYQTCSDLRCMYRVISLKIYIFNILYIYKIYKAQTDRYRKINR